MILRSSLLSESVSLKLSNMILFVEYEAFLNVERNLTSKKVFL